MKSRCFLLSKEGNLYFLKHQGRDSLTAPILCEAAVANALRLSRGPETVALLITKGDEYEIRPRPHVTGNCGSGFFLWKSATKACRAYRLWPIRSGMIELLLRAFWGTGADWRGPYNLDIVVPGKSTAQDEFEESGKEYREKWGGFERC